MHARKGESDLKECHQGWKMQPKSLYPASSKLFFIARCTLCGLVEGAGRIVCARGSTQALY